MMVSITPCLQELLPFVHLKSHFLASERYTNFASAGASLSHVHELLVNRLFKPAQEKVWLGELTVPQ